MSEPLFGRSNVDEDVRLKLTDVGKVFAQAGRFSDFAQAEVLDLDEVMDAVLLEGPLRRHPPLHTVGLRSPLSHG